MAGGIALWALAIWIATLFGLGSRIAPATEGDIGPGPLPQLAPAAPERMASASTYAQIGARPLFAEDRQPRRICSVAPSRAPPAASR